MTNLEARFSWAVKVVQAHFPKEIVTGSSLDSNHRYVIAISGSGGDKPRLIDVLRMSEHHDFDLMAHPDPMTKLEELIEGAKT